MRELLNEIFKQLPQQKADIPGFRDILILASTAGDRVCVKLLLKHGVKHDGQYSTFDTPLGCAAQYGHIHIMKELIHAGADVDCHGFKYHPQDAMVKAIIGGHTATVRLLMQHGAQRTRAQGRDFFLLAVRSGNLEMVDFCSN
jgi:ankyrin repeat protein